MVKNIKNEYFNWLLDILGNKSSDYTNLLKELFTTEFVWTIELDSNRASDGICLRENFADAKRYSVDKVNEAIDFPCSVLEMMIALAVRCETHITIDNKIGNQSYKWFWRMINNLRLSSMTDANYKQSYTKNRLDIFLHREYEKNGVGGLFTISDDSVDMRKIEIWYQLQRYLNELI